MALPKDITGQKFGLLTAIKLTGKKINRKHIWLCKCTCSDELFKEVSISDLNRGFVKSCGCIKGLNNFKHGASKTKTKKGSNQLDYVIWLGIKQRCYDKNNEAYVHYGGKGVTLHNTWLKDFCEFAAYIRTLKNCPPEEMLISRLKGKRLKLSIDRINTRGNYEPSNIKWATSKEQGRNKNNTVMVEYRGKVLPLIEVSETHAVVPHKIVYQRIHSNGWALERALKTPLTRTKQEKKDK